MENTPKRRGRKPKNLNRVFEQKINNTIAPIITHLPISLSEEDNDIFIKNDDKDKKINDLEKQIKNLQNKIKKTNENKKATCYQANFNSDTICWWCKHPFNNPKIELPTKYYNDTFYSYGNFCSYECCHAYNIDLNDEDVFKRASLLNYHYYKTYGKFENINKARDWKILKAFGGNVSIEEYKDNFKEIKEEYYYIKPPMISRFAHIEKVNLDNNNLQNSKYVIKRSKPIKNNNLFNFIKSENDNS